METTARRYDLDWLRIIAFGLLIFYHIGMFYVTWGWHVKSDHASPAIEPLMLVVNPWRLDLLFFISGVATRFLADKMPARLLGWKLAGSRFNRLFWPLVFGMVVIVAPQAFYEIKTDLNYTGSYLEFWGRYLTGYNKWCDQEGCLIVPTWNHLWYVAYLLAYSLIFAFLWPLLKRIPMAWAKTLPAWVYLAVPAAFYWFCNGYLEPRFEETHAFIDDWALHAISFGFFMLGTLVAKFDRLFEIARRWRWLNLATGLIAYGLVAWLRALYYAGQLSLPLEIAFPLGNFIESMQAVFMMMALLGFARQHLAKADGPIRRTLTEAIFPFYIVHQTLTVVAAYELNRLHWPVPVEAIALIVITFGGCWLSYEIVRRIPPLRPLFGLPLRSRKA
ncbi:acyltransferase family protein [Asticcacaulis sp. AC402]|uniref:acyltransferase family protein n=1 Tax=Asticcacaulis sp. AC402 TaxID=1282361 RepID=UPI0003C3DE54|nr:acyltransferase family protein [Asticcacaulis sp. AC402]ESQ74994.1 hypothetical protein ABAC402_11360 [Asticcacaulis sp. AC402]